MNKRNIEAIYQLSPVQQGMLFHSLIAPESGVYVEQMCCTLLGTLDLRAFEQAWRQALDRQAVLRTSFVWEKLDQMLQVVQRQVELPFEHHDWRSLSDEEQQARLEAFLAEDRTRGFDISKAPLLRLALLRMGPADGEDDYRFVFSHHHALLDGWSTPLLFQEVFAFYDAARRGETLQLPPARPYRDYIVRLQKRDADFVAGADAWWARVLDGFTAPTPLVVERLGAPASGGYASRELALSAETTAALQTLARQQQLTPSAIFQGAWAVLLSRYSGEADVLFGATVSGRPADLPGVEEMIGMFINTLPVRAGVRPDAPVIDLLKALQAQQAELRQYECCSLVEIQSRSGIPRGLPLFESILVFENFPVAQLGARMDASLEGGRGGVTISDVRIHEQTNYPLTVVASPGERMQLKITYDTSRFDDDAIGRMLGHLQTLLEGIAADSASPISALPMLTESERQELLSDWNQTEASYPAQACVHQLFEEQAARTPEAVAVEFAGQTLSYRDLNARANQLAHWLAKAGVGPETLVGLSIERSPEMVVAVLGVLKAGGAYVPIDPSYPSERLSFMLDDSKVSILLTEAHLKERLPAANARLVCLDADWPEIARQESTNLITEVRPENLAYVIYTSGSTGKPKGTLIEHRGVVNYLTWAIEAYRVADGQGSVVHSSISFDLTVTSLFAPLLAGKRVLLAREDQGVESLGEALRETSDLSLVKITPAHLEMLGHQLKPGEAAGRTRGFIIGGENLLPEHIAFWREHAPETALINEYGPTETVVGCCVYEVKPGERFAGPLPIGRPIANTRLYVLDQHLQPVPVGVPGELYIGGAGVGRGYLNRPELTAERFVELRINGGTGSQPVPALKAGQVENLSYRVYKTGDLVRWLPNGELQCLGRMDDQVKIRGYRIELGEIESAIKQHAGVRDAAVIAREDAPGDRRLAAYVVARPGRALPVGELQQYLEPRLPAYMLPSAYVMLDAIPLTSNGKVDNRALPIPIAGRDVRAPGYVAPRTPVEELLAGIWAHVLGVERVGVEDDFFALGGHSLLATQLVSRVRDAFAVELPLRGLFDNPTVAGMAVEVEALNREAAGVPALSMEAVPRDGGRHTGQPLPLSFSQQRLWFLDQLEPGSAAYNNPAAVRVRGLLEIGVLERSLNEVVRRHEILRTHFAMSGGRPEQVIAPSLETPIEVNVCSTLDEARRLAAEEAHRPFDLSTLSGGPLLRMRLLRLADDDHVLVLVMHHIVSDGWSLDVLIRELAALYQAFSAGAPSPLADLPLQYADYAKWQRRSLEGERLERQLDYWRNQLGEGGGQVLTLPYDRPRPAVQTDAGAQEIFHLPSELIETLSRISRRENVTLFMTLMGAFQTLLHRYSGQAEINVGTPIAGRTRSELEGLIGFFVNTLVMHADFSGDPSFRDFLKQVRETALGAYAHQDLPFEQLVEAVQPKRDLSHSPLFQVMFMLHTSALSHGQALTTAGLDFSDFEIENRLARFDLTLELIEEPESLGGVLAYNTDLFDAATIRRMISHFRQLLEAVAADPSRRVSQLPLLTEAERREMLVEWNDTAAPFDADRCFHHLFEDRVARQPERVAASFEGRRLSYRELNERANQLAHYLRSRGVGPETIVALCVDRSLEMVVAQLGIMKAGAAWLPLDPHYPEERLAFMFADSQAPVLLTQSHLADRSAGFTGGNQTTRVIELDREWARIAGESVANPAAEVRPDNLAYVIYTSGSTGQPKGTLIEHRGLCNLAMTQQESFDLGPDKRVLQFSPFSFDASVWEMAMALGSGAELVLARQETLASLSDLHRLLRRERITTVTLPPSLLRLLPHDDLPELETVIAAGERCTWEIVNRWSPGRWFFNAYGPTETTVCATMEFCREGAVGDPSIGRPLPNTQLFVLDKQGQPVPAGVPGELHIGGVSLARGYLRRPEMTAERFVEIGNGDWGLGTGVSNPQPPAPIRLYKTGDLVRYRADGRIEYLGRVDEQVKIRGHRIELGEIEARLREYPEVCEATVAAIEDVTGDKRLVGYFVTVNGAVPTTAELREHLRERLPEFMTPSNFVWLERLPLSPSGKVDRAALPIPDGARPNLDHEYVGPRTGTEQQLAALWAELLGVERIGVEDDFFELGGHSLLATQLASRVRETMQVELPLRTLFEAPSVAALAWKVEEMKQAATSEAEELARLIAQLETMPEDQALVMMVSGD